MEAFEERLRDTHSFARRVGRLPEQREADKVDYRSLLHRDGSVLSAVSLKVRVCCVCGFLSPSSVAEIGNSKCKVKRPPEL